MFVTIVDNGVFVRLSRRNLRQLDAMLYCRDTGQRCLARKDQNGVSLVVQVEEDGDHYDGPDPGWPTNHLNVPAVCEHDRARDEQAKPNAVNRLLAHLLKNRRPVA